jgi:hypothetical protein
MKRLAAALTVSALAILTACGGGDGAEPGDASKPTSQPDDATPDHDAPSEGADGSAAADDGAGSAAGDSPMPPGAVGGGSVTIDGAQFDGSVFRCAPRYIDMGAELEHEDDLNLLASVGAGGLQIEIGHSEGFTITADGTGMESFVEQTLNVFYSGSGDQGTEQFEAFAARDAANAWFRDYVPMPGQEPEQPPLADAPYTRDGANIRGTMILEQIWPEEASGTIDVTYDLPIPDEINDC